MAGDTPGDLNRRARKILQAVVQEYLHTGDAVGSRTVTKRQGVDLSPATVRNVMSDLEDMGLLKQPHTSAGRVPTTMGLRFFIDSMLRVRSLSPEERDRFRQQFGLDAAHLDEALDRTSRVLSELASQAAIVVAPVPERQRLEAIDFVRLRDDAVLAVLVTSDGQVQNKLLTGEALEGHTDAAFLQRASNYLNELVRGLSLHEARSRILDELGKDKGEIDEMMSRALSMVQGAVAPGTPGVIVSGKANLVEARGDVEATRALLRALEEKERVVKLLDRTLAAEGIQVWLGAETAFGELSELSVVASPYGPEDRPLGTIAVIGPQRMNYSRVIPLVDFTADLVSDILRRG